MSVIKWVLGLAVAGVGVFPVAAQDADWQLGKDGVNLKGAQKLLRDRPAPATVKVAVIDTGTEIDHPGLEGRIWRNPGELAGNGLDDDHNGYVDDVHGWSYLCGADTDLHHEAYESARMARALGRELRERWEMPEAEDSIAGWEATWQALLADGSPVAASVLELHGLWTEVSREAREGHNNIASELEMGTMLYGFIQTVERETGQTFSKDALKAFSPSPGLEDALKGQMLNWLRVFDAAALRDDIAGMATRSSEALQRSYLDMDSLRLAVVGDGPGVLDPGFGCTRVEGPDAEHGTHVSGIIAGRPGPDGRGNGVAPNALLITLRAVPNGDERDEDIARAIRYAVDQGARVINCSFGKSRSPGKHWVDDALQYAASQGVLVVHAAGNDARDSDVRPSYPSRTLGDGSGTRMTNWLEVGASSSRRGRRVLADFSNYGATVVDVFAPGDGIYAAIPDGGYGFNSGTSMAAPVVSGVAAFLWGYFPDLTAADMREAIMASVRKPRRAVYIPGTRERVPMEALCVSGGLVDARRAVQWALAWEASRAESPAKR